MGDYLQKTASRIAQLEHMASNTVFLGLATVCNYAFSFLTVAYAVRALQPEAMGSYFSLLSKMGILLYGMREVAAARGAGKGLAQLTRELFCLGALLALIATALFAMCVGSAGSE